jgi:hypothetical protein
MELLICPKEYRDGKPCGIVASSPEPETWRQQSVNRSIVGKTIQYIEWPDPHSPVIILHFTDGLTTLFISAIS